MIKSVLRELFDGKVYPAENIVPKDPEFQRICHEIEEEETHLEEVLTPDGQQRFEKLNNLYNQSSLMYGYECFSHGFSLGVTLTIEALIGSAKLSRDD